MQAIWTLRAMCAGGALGLAGMALAEPVSGKAARELVFKSDAVEVVIAPVPGLSEQDIAALRFAAAQQPYYSAIAMAPSEGLLSEATLAAQNFHDPDAARAAALRGCDSARKGGAPCVIAAEIRPEGWQPRALSLSAAATEALQEDYGRGRGEKALAISPGTGKWAVQKGADAGPAALAACATQGATDCQLAVADD
ncbi:MAG: 5-aminolevulic acid synthase [Rhodobacteraceae bacterium]|nr:5-aminolevulic acid synthase [Paracoccaceae bacterium]